MAIPSPNGNPLAVSLFLSSVASCFAQSYPEFLLTMTSLQSELMQLMVFSLPSVLTRSNESDGQCARNLCFPKDRFQPAGMARHYIRSPRFSNPLCFDLLTASRTPVSRSSYLSHSLQPIPTLLHTSLSSLQCTIPTSTCPATSVSTFLKKNGLPSTMSKLFF
jgi:hypothetical protein